MAAETVASMPAVLPDLKVKVSTGRVVDFRNRNSLRDKPDDECVPLVYPGNLRRGVVQWPRAIRKPQGFVVRDDVERKALVPPGCYVLVKRFSAKEERRRLVAAVWDPDVNGNSAVAFENHLNVFHDDGGGIQREIAYGLSVWLNSTVVDQFFRTFSGHTQVNATDLRSLRYPSAGMLAAIGRKSRGLLPGQAEIDRLVLAQVRPKVAV